MNSARPWARSSLTAFGAPVPGGTASSYSAAGLSRGFGGHVAHVAPSQPCRQLRFGGREFASGHDGVL